LINSCVKENDNEFHFYQVDCYIKIIGSNKLIIEKENVSAGPRISRKRSTSLIQLGWWSWSSPPPHAKPSCVGVVVY